MLRGLIQVEALKEAAGMMTGRHMGKANNLKGHAAEAAADSAGTRFLLRWYALMSSLFGCLVCWKQRQYK